MSDLFEELKIPPPGSPGEEEYNTFLQDLQKGVRPDVIGQDVIERMIASFTQTAREAPGHELRRVMAAYGYQLDSTDPDCIVYRKM